MSNELWIHIFSRCIRKSMSSNVCSVLFSHVVISLSWFESLEILVSTAARHGLFWIISHSWSRVMPPLPPAKKTSATRNGRSWTQLRLEMERRHMSLQVAAGGCVSHMSCHRISWGSVHLVQLRHPNRLDSQSYSWTKWSRFEALLYFKSSRAVGYSVCFPCCGYFALRVCGFTVPSFHLCYIMYYVLRYLELFVLSLGPSARYFANTDHATIASKRDHC